MVGESESSEHRDPHYEQRDHADRRSGRFWDARTQTISCGKAFAVKGHNQATGANVPV
jgi:hypothetical protein